MTDIIHLLPDSIANQIAAGEVIQRPASVVKELVENSLDADARHIHIIITDAGRTLVQVIDDGKGMSTTDARMSFERHATSKIKTTGDLFALYTRGFRGEALASVAAIAQVELKTRRAEDEMGTLLKIAGSKVESQEAAFCAVGTTISVKNIFFNVPARRKFLKSNETERRNIFTEIERIALVNPAIEFTVVENDVQTMHLPPANLRQRIVQMQGKGINQQLIEINEETTLAKIHGYISTPQFAKKGRASQFFFVNNRYIRHPFFHKAVMTAYEPLISAAENPNYFICFEVEPDTIDVNIHPTKTEVKFENERTLWQILMVTVKESLGKFNAIPSIDFDTADAPDIPIFDPSKPASMPKVSVNPDYNPFQASHGDGSRASRPRLDWEQLYKGFENEGKETSVSPDPNAALFQAGHSSSLTSPKHYQYKQKYILTSVKSGLMIIDQHRSHVRILFDKYLSQITDRKGISQRVLFPEMIELTSSEASSLSEIMGDMEALGFELSDLGNNTFAIQGVPSELQNIDAVALVRSMIDKNIETGCNIQEEVHESLALSMANFTAIPVGKLLSEEEMQLMVNQLFACQSPNHTPDGKAIITVISDDEMDNKLKSF
ncbi:MAG TPA: DNA mismatch repair endonuclease MutL [Petrimonas sp.]|uniref:DNA mismatch repair endonuclease MutL n=1 Tax=Petrimonas sp. TaxID=2023866 RepID=UPI001759890C|nr:DNA mismatch repair endonuclease MutL [Petrimonas sp.]